jgi:hypothetical protein
VGSLALRPGDSLTIPRMAWSVGFIRFVSSADATQATGVLTVPPVGLAPTEHASLRWTHSSAKTPSATSFPPKTSLIYFIYKLGLSSCIPHFLDVDPECPTGPHQNAKGADCPIGDRTPLVQAARHCETLNRNSVVVEVEGAVTRAEGARLRGPTTMAPGRLLYLL